MAQPELESFDRRGFAFKIESDEGIDAEPDPEIDGVMLLNGTSGTEFDKVERPLDRPHFTNNPFSIANKRAFIEGDLELFPPAVPGDASDGIPHQDSILRTGGMARVLDAIEKTTIYNPISSGIASGSGYWWHVDNHLRTLGTRCAISNMRMAIGEIPMCRVRAQGSYDIMRKEALPTIALPDFQPNTLQADNSTAIISTVGSSAIEDLTLWAKELSVDFGTELNTKEFTSKKVNSISDRLATWSLLIARADLEDFNPWELRDAGTLVTSTINQTYSALELLVFLTIRGQIETIEPADIDGDMGWQIGGPCIASDSGGDEFLLGYEDLSE